MITSPLLLPGVGAGQVVEFDAASGKHKVTYMSNSLGRFATALVESPNKIEPSLRLVAIEESDGESAYHYLVSNGTGLPSQQGVKQFDLECPPRDVVSVTPPANWRPWLLAAQDGFECRLTEKTGGEKAIVPGQTLHGLVVRTPKLPAVGRARFWGNADEVQWPDGETMESMELAVIDTIYRLDGITGGWVERTAVVPTRDPLEFGAAGILEAVRKDVATMCEEGIWIAESSCPSLHEDLAELVASAQEERWGDASKGAAELLGRVEATWKEPGGQLESDAYWLLRRNLEAVIASMR